jgi:cleavage and polyadenylation specificity factor subunit 3
MDAVIIIFETPNQLSINWIGNAMNDTIADAVLAIIIAAESSPVSLQVLDMTSPHAAVPRQERAQRVLLFLEAQFGNAMKRVEDGVEIRVDEHNAHVAKLDLETMEVECKWELLGSRVSRIVKRAIGVVAPFGAGGVQDGGSLLGEIESYDLKQEDGNGVVKMEEE